MIIIDVIEVFELLLLQGRREHQHWSWQSQASLAPPMPSQILYTKIHHSYINFNYHLLGAKRNMLNTSREVKTSKK
jgi:hypothetical protein